MNGAIASIILTIALHMISVTLTTAAQIIGIYGAIASTIPTIKFFKTSRIGAMTFSIIGPIAFATPSNIAPKLPSHASISSPVWSLIPLNHATPKPTRAPLKSGIF